MFLFFPPFQAFKWENKVFISLKMSQIQKEIDQLEQLISNTAFISESDEDSFEPPSLSDEDPEEEPILFSLEDEISQEVLELEREEVEVGTEAESRDKVETNQLIVLGLNRDCPGTVWLQQRGPWLQEGQLGDLEGQKVSQRHKKKNSVNTFFTPQ